MPAARRTLPPARPSPALCGTRRSAGAASRHRACLDRLVARARSSRGVPRATTNPTEASGPRATGAGAAAWRRRAAPATSSRSRPRAAPVVRERADPGALAAGLPAVHHRVRADLPTLSKGSPWPHSRNCLRSSKTCPGRSFLSKRPSDASSRPSGALDRRGPPARRPGPRRPTSRRADSRDAATSTCWVWTKRGIREAISRTRSSSTTSGGASTSPRPGPAAAASGAPARHGDRAPGLCVARLAGDSHGELLELELRSLDPVGASSFRRPFSSPCTAKSRATRTPTTARCSRRCPRPPRDSCPEPARRSTRRSGGSRACAKRTVRAGDGARRRCGPAYPCLEDGHRAETARAGEDFTVWTAAAVSRAPRSSIRA